ncbi:SIR2 family protein [Endozoicomonas sp. 2B-B]
MIHWPKNLIREIAHRRVALFLGAGVSSSSTDNQDNNPKSWSAFLSEASSLIKGDRAKREVSELIKNRNYLLALQAISDESDPSDYHALLNENFNNPGYTPSKLHEIIMKLDSNIVITTNFDKIYENYCESTSQEGYKVVTYDTGNLGDHLRSDQRVIIKAHGTINDFQKMIFTKSQYHKAKADYPHFYEILKAILLTKTCIFIGCGMDDPDILLMLEDVKITSSSTFPHYALIKANSHSKFAIRDWQETYNIRALEYGPEHTNLIDDLDELFTEVEAVRSITLGT